MMESRMNVKVKDDFQNGMRQHQEYQKTKDGPEGREPGCHLSKGKTNIQRNRNHDQYAQNRTESGKSDGFTCGL